MSSLAIIDEIRKAQGAHAAWKLKLSTAVKLGNTDLDPATVKRDDLCEFGKWLHGPSIDEEIKSGLPYNVISRLHSEFHVCASQVLDQIKRGNIDAARNLLDNEYTQRSDKLFRAMNKWRKELTAENHG